MEADPATGNNNDQGKCLGTKLGALHSQLGAVNFTYEIINLTTNIDNQITVIMSIFISIPNAAVCTPHRHLGSTALYLVFANPWEQWVQVPTMPW